MIKPNPNRKPFPRRRFVERYGHAADVHELLRDGHEDYFRLRNEDGWHHDLGAQDVFLDNAGLIFQEQVDPELWHKHMRDHKILLHRWESLQKEVLQRDPWWGRNFNSLSRSANAGEPRSLLRFMHDVTLRDLATRNMSDASLGEFSRFDDWSPERLLSAGSSFGGLLDPPPFVGGVPLPPDWSSAVERLRILPPSAATPDLPLRLGFEARNKRIYRQAVRDQGHLGTCTANAVASALDIAGLRANPRNRLTASSRLSAAWLHAQTGTKRNAGRSVGSLARFVGEKPICSDVLFPYPRNKQELQRWAQDTWLPTLETVIEDHERLSDYWGGIEVRELQKTGTEADIPKLKAHLAAGWVVVIATSMPDVVHTSSGLNTYGAVSVPPLGSGRSSAGGHAWTLVGYDHIDGNSQWKYQGHFLAMTSWGAEFPTKQMFGPGIVAIPFSYFLSESFEAWGFRFIT